MASPPSEAAMKERITRHMNADHQDSIARYVEQFCSCPRILSSTAQMTDISTKSMTLITASVPIPFNILLPFFPQRTYTVPFEPPLSGFSEARSRLVAMDVSARESLSRSPVTVKSYKPPVKPMHVFVFVLCATTYFMLSSESFVLPGGWAYEAFLKWVPGLPEFTSWARLPILVLMILIHLVEAGIMTNTCTKHSVNVGTLVWWAWVVSSFIEGFGAFQRFWALVAKQQEILDKQKH